MVGGGESEGICAAVIDKCSMQWVLFYLFFCFLIVEEVPAMGGSESFFKSRVKTYLKYLNAVHKSSIKSSESLTLYPHRRRDRPKSPQFLRDDNAHVSLLYPSLPHFCCIHLNRLTIIANNQQSTAVDADASKSVDTGHIGRPTMS